MPKLNGFVHVRTEDGRMVVFGPDDRVPDWALAQMDDGCFGAAPARVETSASDTRSGTTPPQRDEPPRAGKGSSRQAWADYAAWLGIAVTDDMTRDDIIAAVDGQ